MWGESATMASMQLQPEKGFPSIRLSSGNSIGHVMVESHPDVIRTLQLKFICCLSGICQATLNINIPQFAS